MRWFLYGIGIFYIAFGTFAILYTDACRRAISLMTSDRYTKIMSIAVGILSLLIIAASSQSRNRWFLVLIGVLGLAKCLFFLIGPKQARVGLIESFVDTSAQTWRLYGIFGLVLGTAITSWVI